MRKTDNSHIVTHPRLYGGDNDHMEHIDYVPYLKYIARKPRSLFSSGIYEIMPPSMQKYMRTCESADRGRILKVLSELTDRTGFDSALETVDEAIRYQANDPESLKNLYRRLYADVPALPPLETKADISLGRIIRLNTDLSVLDSALKGGVVNG